MAAKFSQQLFDVICERIASGESLTQICKADDMPSKSVVLSRVLKDAELADQYARAREVQAEALVQEIISIADESEVEAVYQGEDIVLQLSNTAIQRNRLRVDARKWYASKVLPKKYGDKTETTITGPDGGPVTIQTIERVIVDPTNTDG